MAIILPILGLSETLTLSPSKIIAVGLNYRDHIAESASVAVKGFDDTVPDEPVLFNKTPNVLIGNDDPIPIPVAVQDSSWPSDPRTDYEGELVVIMGSRCRHVSSRKALQQVLGYTCGLDISQRNIQNSDRSGWFRGKSFDGFGPVGPALLPAEGVDPQNLSIKTRLNGSVVQSSHTSRMIFPVADLIAFISRQFTLEKGDLIFTGTPSGVGPLKEKDRVDVEISGIGVLSCPVVNEVVSVE